ncbi:MAG: hypothetical protein WC378_14280 [Opitutaceae bacterium]
MASPFFVSGKEANHEKHEGNDESNGRAADKPCEKWDKTPHPLPNVKGEPRAPMA